ncbi:[NiFe] hydrogenase nickel incorporation-associated protein HypB [Amycolatopsis camponoti]|uniref:[NiFe] hydrogenase nickel incorporation-associated protein HypB n=1 Tax=Amycolatopsis camponoti TaxID=2606593 RepID=A0A6I8M869_9PSEU|nr:hydrogenase nickel incorporation protein HypB [Amycolatopsis camponoti]VVJ23805.1 [NiFe] hydrogenase nickel incorporation-associated protein HypB [Amycolatopsis camponoti]
MCDTCGCSDSDVRITDHAHTVVMEQDILAKNDELASHNRAHLRSSGVFAINLMSSPGAGKTTLLERTIRASDTPCAVIEGDQETLLDAERIKATGAPVVQINTGAGCHLDASMLHRALHSLSPAQGSTLFIENVGNLVCPALFDLGEAARVVVLSVTEGPGKPLKYPHMFAATDLVLLNKVDLLPYVDFDVAEFERDTRRVNPSAAILQVSATRGDGLSEWYDWLRRPARS